MLRGTASKLYEEDYPFLERQSRHMPGPSLEETLSTGHWKNIALFFERKISLDYIIRLYIIEEATVTFSWEQNYSGSPRVLF